MTFICLVLSVRIGTKKLKGAFAPFSFFLLLRSLHRVCVFVFAKCKMQNAAFDDSQNEKKAPPKWGGAFSDKSKKVYGRDPSPCRSVRVRPASTVSVCLHIRRNRRVSPVRG